MLYSETTGMAHCFICKLFADSETHFISRFNDWKHINRLHEHENSESHRNASLSAASFKTKNTRVDNSFLVQIDKEEVYWREVLKRVVTVVKFLCERGLPLPGGNEVFGSAQNGNFLGLLELLAQFDDFLADPICRFGNSGRGVPVPLCLPIFLPLYATNLCNLWQRKLQPKLRNKKAKYYSITMDSAPDVTHVQLYM